MVHGRKEDSEDVIIWVRMPKGISVEKIKQLDLDKLHKSDCYGGDTCICAPTFTKDAGIVVNGSKTHDFKELLKRAGLIPSPKCFGGDMCIV